MLSSAFRSLLSWPEHHDEDLTATQPTPLHAWQLLGQRVSLIGRWGGLGGGLAGDEEGLELLVE